MARSRSASTSHRQAVNLGLQTLRRQRQSIRILLVRGKLPPVHDAIARIQADPRMPANRSRQRRNRSVLSQNHHGIQPCCTSRW